MNSSDILRSLRASGEYSDLTVICVEREFHVHRNIVCLQSAWFRAACEGRWQEGTAGVIRLASIDPNANEEDFSRDDPDAVNHMIDCMHLNEHGPSSIRAFAEDEAPMEPKEMEPQPASDDEEWSSDSPPDISEEPVETLDIDPTKHKQNRLVMHVRLYALGCKYDIKSLRELSVDKLKSALNETWTRHELAYAIHVAFNSTLEQQGGVRDALIENILACAADLASDPIIEKAVNAVEGLAFELFKRQSSNAGKVKRRRW